MRRFEIIGINNSNWSKIISLSCEYDSYHTSSYSKLELLEGNKEPVLLVASIDDDFIAMPLVIRKIPNSDLYDCTSAYGYCGPISNLPSESVPRQLIVYFQHKLQDFFLERNIVSAFSRLHPLINQSVFLNGIGRIKSINETVSIDLKLPEQQQLKQYRKSCKSEINQLRKDGFYVTEATTENEVENFIVLYHERMKKVEAAPQYFFTNEYFNTILNNRCFKSKLLLAKINDEIAAGAIFTLTNKFMQYHLAVSQEEYRHNAPMKLILDEARKIGISLNISYLHLGGGVNGRNNDSLFRFKSGFSDFRHIFQVWQLIINEDKYSYLTDLFKIDREKNQDYFPLYRIKTNGQNKG